jgi:hypothetical protein
LEFQSLDRPRDRTLSSIKTPHFIKEKGGSTLVKKKKNPKKKRRSSPSLSPEEQARLDALLQDLDVLHGLDLKTHIPGPSFAQALIEALPLDASQTPRLLVVLKEAFDDKNVQKAVKKAAFKLRQRGTPMPELEVREETPFIIQKREKEEPVAFLGSIDGVGSRAVFIGLPQMAKGVDLGMGVVNDEQGIMEFSFGRYSKKQVKEVQAIFFDKVRPVVETTLAHAATVLETAYRDKGAARRNASRNYLQLRPWLLEHVSLLENAPIYEFLSLDSAPQEMLTPSQMERLLGHDLFKTWIVDPDELKPVVAEVIKVEESPILVSEAQKMERINQIKEDALVRLYPDDKRRRIQKRLEEMAYVFLKLEEEALARLAVAAALSFNEKDTRFQVNPILKALLERTLNLLLPGSRESGRSKEPEGGPPPSIIVPP